MGQVRDPGTCLCGTLEGIILHGRCFGSCWLRSMLYMSGSPLSRPADASVACTCANVTETARNAACLGKFRAVAGQPAAEMSGHSRKLGAPSSLRRPLWLSRAPCADSSDVPGCPTPAKKSLSEMLPKHQTVKHPTQVLALDINMLCFPLRRAGRPAAGSEELPEAGMVGRQAWMCCSSGSRNIKKLI